MPLPLALARGGAPAAAPPGRSRRPSARAGPGCPPPGRAAVLPRASGGPAGPAPTGPLPPSPADDAAFMRLALGEARRALDAGEVPVGAVAVAPSGEVLAVGRNATEAARDPTAHAEMSVVRAAAARLGAWRLSGVTVYTTLEPCPMCAGALLQARVSRVVFGAPSELLGCAGSWLGVLPTPRGRGGLGAPGAGAGAEADPAAAQRAEAARRRRDRVAARVSGLGSDDGASASELAALAARLPRGPGGGRGHPFWKGVAVDDGVLAEECAGLLRDFFASRRGDEEGAAGARPLHGRGEPADGSGCA